MLNLLKSKFMYVASFVLGTSFLTLGIAGNASASPSSTPEEVLDAVAGGTIDSAVDLMQYVITNYLKYILVIGICFALYYAFRKFTRIGTR
jgi:hypothetical protein